MEQSRLPNFAIKLLDQQNREQQVLRKSWNTVHFDMCIQKS